MQTLNQQIGVLQRDAEHHGRWCGVSVVESDHRIVIDLQISLPNGWNKKSAKLKLEVPMGYPFAAPKGFFIDKDLRRDFGGLPAGIVAKYSTKDFYWMQCEPLAWNPNYDTLLTYINLVRQKCLNVCRKN